MPIDDFSVDKPDTAPNAATTPGKYIKIAVPDFSDVATNVNPTTMAPTPLTSYLRLGAVEDVAKAGKATGTVGLITDMEGNPLSLDKNAPFNPSYEPYADFGGTNLPHKGSPALPPATTPTGSSLYNGAPPKGAAAFPTASGPDPTGEDLASLVQGFADDSRNRGTPRMRLPDKNKDKKKVKYTGGGQPDDSVTTAQGPLYGYPWVAPVMGAKAPGQLDAKDTSKTEDAVYTASSKPVFFPDDYRTLESSQLHTKGGWRDHTDGNRITTTRGDKVEVIRGNYKLIVLGRQDQTKPKFAGMDLSGGQSDTGGGDLSADASADFNQGSTAFSSLFEWRQVSTKKLYEEALKAGSEDPNLKELQKQAEKDQKAAAAAQKTLNDLTVKAQKDSDPYGYLQATLIAAQKCVFAAETTVEATQAAAALAAAKKALQTAEQAVEVELLEGTALVVLAATAPAGTTSDISAAARAAAKTAADAAWTATGVSDAVTAAKAADSTNDTSPSYENAYQAYLAWTGTAVSTTVANQNTADATNATNTATAAATAAAAAAQAQAASDAAAAAAAANPADANLAKAATSAATAATAAAAAAATAEQVAADAAAQAKADAALVPTAALPTAVAGALSAWTKAVAPQTVAANAAQAAVKLAELDKTTPLGLDATDALAAALAAAAYSTTMAEAAAIAAGLYTTPLETLSLWEDTDKAPDDFRSVSTSKKGSGPKVQVKFQRGGKVKDGKEEYEQVPGDGVTYGLPISMGVSINETWSYQIYNYSGIGYYPATAPQPWPPPPPKTQTQPVGLTADSKTLTGTGLPSVPPDRDEDATKPWSPVPRWVIYPVAKIVNKSYVIDQSSETYVKRTVTVTAGPRLDYEEAPKGKHKIDPLNPDRTYAADVTKWRNAAGHELSGYKDTEGHHHTLPSTTTYDRNLLTEDDLKFPSDKTLSSWILDTTGSVNLPVRDYNKIDQTWTETHVKKQATFVRAGTTLSDTVVGSQNTKVKATSSNSNTTVTGQQHTILNAGSTLSETTVGAQTTTTHAASSSTNTNIDGQQYSDVHAGSIIQHTASPIQASTNTAIVSAALKLFLIDLQFVMGFHIGMNVGVTLDVQVGPHFGLKLLELHLNTDLTKIIAGSDKLLAGEHVIL